MREWSTFFRMEIGARTRHDRSGEGLIQINISAVQGESCKRSGDVKSVMGRDSLDRLSDSDIRGLSSRSMSCKRKVGNGLAWTGHCKLR
jgi:hypothetical protein